jgi:hypothetical protein
VCGKKRKDHALVDGARVSCPLRGIDVDLEEGMACAKGLRVIDDDPPSVRGRRVALQFAGQLLF